jgi:hypothetical protein
MGEWEPGSLLNYYDRPKAPKVNDRMKRRLLANRRLMLASAELALNDHGILVSDYGTDLRNNCLWLLDRDLDDYRYPWQPAQERNRTMLSDVINMP